MADTKISALTSASALDGTEVLPVVQGGSTKRTTTGAVKGIFRGALVSKSADQTGNFTTDTVIPWDAEQYDTDSIHDNVTNNTRLTVPPGASKVRLSYNVVVSSVTGSTNCFAALWKNGSITFIGNATVIVTNSTSGTRLCATSAVIPVTPGDYFECEIATVGDTSVVISSSLSWFQMEIIS